MELTGPPGKQKETEGGRRAVINQATDVTRSHKKHLIPFPKSKL